MGSSEQGKQETPQLPVHVSAVVEASAKGGNGTSSFVEDYEREGESPVRPLLGSSTLKVEEERETGGKPTKRGEVTPLSVKFIDPSPANVAAWKNIARFYQ